MGAFQGEWHINLHISPTTCSCCFIVFAMILIYHEDPKTRKNHSVWCAGWSETAYGCSKSRVHAAAAEAGGQNLQVSSSAALESHIRAELETCRLWPPALGACKKYTHFWPQITPSGIFVKYVRIYQHTCVHVCVCVCVLRLNFFATHTLNVMYFTQRKGTVSIHTNDVPCHAPHLGTACT